MLNDLCKIFSFFYFFILSLINVFIIEKLTFSSNKKNKYQLTYRKNSKPVSILFSKNSP